jgi:hypothetical protein
VSAREPVGDPAPGVPLGIDGFGRRRRGRAALYLDERTDVDDYLATTEMLCVQALPSRETRDALVAVRDELGR